MKSLIAFALALALILAATSASAYPPQALLVAPQAGYGTCAAQQALPVQMVPVQMAPSYGCYGGGGAAALAAPVYSMPVQAQTFVPAAALGNPYVAAGLGSAFAPVRGFSPGFGSGFSPGFAAGGVGGVGGVTINSKRVNRNNLTGIINAAGGGPVIINTKKFKRNF